MRLFGGFLVLLLLAQPSWAMVCAPSCDLQPAAPQAVGHHSQMTSMSHCAHGASLSANTQSCGIRAASPLQRAESLTLYEEAENVATVAPLPSAIANVTWGADTSSSPPARLQVLRI